MSSTTTITQAPTVVTVTQQPAITAENVLRLFPEVNTDLIGGSHNSAANDDALDGYDEEQIRLMDEVCIVLDNNDIPIGSATKKLCQCTQHLGKGQFIDRALTREQATSWRTSIEASSTVPSRSFSSTRRTDFYYNSARPRRSRSQTCGPIHAVRIR
jgi:hypothetical protein